MHCKFVNCKYVHCKFVHCKYVYTVNLCTVNLCTVKSKHFFTCVVNKKWSEKGKKLYRVHICIFVRYMYHVFICHLFFTGRPREPDPVRHKRYFYFNPINTASLFIRATEEYNICNICTVYTVTKIIRISAQKTSIAEPKLFIFGFGSDFDHISAPAPAPAPAIYWHFKLF